VGCLGVQQRQQHHNSSSAAHKKMSYLWSPTQCWQAAQLRSADSFTVSVLNEGNWDARLGGRFPLPLYGLPYRTSRPPVQDLRDATTQTLLGKCHATEKHCVPDIPYSCTCMSDLLQRSQKIIHSRCCLSTTNQPVRLFSMLFTRFVTSSEESRRRRYSSSIQAPRNAWHPWHRVDLCVPLSPLPREGRRAWN
jgi:hypothetical protein